MLNFARLSAYQAFRPGFAYVVRGAPYLSLTNECNCGISLLKSRGPSFSMPPTTGFSPLIHSAEPTSAELSAIVKEIYRDPDADRGSMGETDPGVVFAGYGEPLLRVDTLLDTVKLVKEEQNGVPFRINTNGLFFEDDDDVVQKLLDSGLVAVGDDDMRRETRIQSISVFLPSNSAAAYAEIMQPPEGKGLLDVIGFITSLAEAGVQVECTAVEHPAVDLAKTESLAMALGASSFRTRTYHP